MLHIPCFKYFSARILYKKHNTNCDKDDTLLYVIGDKVEDTVTQMNDDLATLFGKICQNKLKLNVDKTKVMVITNKLINIDEIHIFVNGVELSLVDQIKYLGVIIDG